jgi:[ribosomal protein S5]-alanine N-acetyltransferase
LFPRLETARLDLVEIHHAFIDRYFEIMSNDEVTKFYGMDRLKTREEAAHIVDSFQLSFSQKRGIRWGILLKENQRFIGTIGLNNINMPQKRAEIGYELDPTFWRVGITPEAVKEVLRYSFDELNLYRIGAVTFLDNQASIDLLEKIGFEREGILKGYIYQNNQHNDAYIFAYLNKK